MPIMFEFVNVHLVQCNVSRIELFFYAGYIAFNEIIKYFSSNKFFILFTYVATVMQ